MKYCLLNIGVSKTKMEQYSDNCILYWGQQTFYKIIPLDPNSNTPHFYSASGTTKFRLFANQFDQQFQKIRDNKILTFINVVPDSEGEHDNYS